MAVPDSNNFGEKRDAMLGVLHVISIIPWKEFRIHEIFANHLNSVIYLYRLYELFPICWLVREDMRSGHLSIIKPTTNLIKSVKLHHPTSSFHISTRLYSTFLPTCNRGSQKNGDPNLQCCRHILTCRCHLTNLLECAMLVAFFRVDDVVSSGQT